jgi:GT2 family glycosyltransferase
MTPRISFIVPVRNAAADLETCLQSIRRNESAPHQVEVVVVDNGSSDGSAEVARRFGATVIVIEDARVSELRNRAALHATGEVLAFVDADNEIVSGWVAAALESLDATGVGLVGALYRAPADGTWVQRAYGYLRGRPRGRHEIAWLNSGNIAVWRHAFEAVRGFDTTLEACEDVDLCHRIRAIGLRIVSDARLESVHHGDPRTLSELFASELWRGRDNLRVSFRSPVVWTSVPSAIVPILDALMIGAAVLGIVATLAAWRPGLLVTAAAMLVFAGGAWLKVIRAGMRTAGARGVGILQAFIVSCVYDLGRALALVSRAQHRGSRPPTAAATS